ncbi:MAG TPA: MFS transporter [Candidatus Dormibacteraeota bacterium]|nr:MFS transporter [Candidatus Dormibacteraeota bacterium]
MPLVLVAFVALGMPDGMLGVAWPSIRGTFDQPLAALGQLLIAGTCGYLSASSASGFLTDRLGTGALLTGSACASGLAMLAFAAAPSWPLLLAGSLVLGLGAGGIDAGGNAYVALRHGAGTMNVMHGCYGIGATLGPLAVTAAIAGGASWRLPYAGMLAVEAVLVAAFGLTARVWGGRRHDEASAPAGPVAGRWLLVGLVAALFFVYTAFEVATGQWSFSFLTLARAEPATAAGLAVSGYWGGLTACRLATALVATRLGPRRLLHLSMAGTVVALGLFWWNPVPAVGLAGLVLAGVGLAPIFPALVTLTPGRVGAGLAARVVGVQIAAAGSGGALGPAGLGLVLQRAGVGLLAPVLFAGAVGMAALHVVVSAIDRSGGRDRV